MYTTSKINEIFGNERKLYKKCRDKYWYIVAKYKWSPSNRDFPTMDNDEYAHWYPFHLLMQEKFSPLLHGK